MTQITGKIYQMKNAEGTENRFPRTVIEGVLGLSSYLQNQFSSLADIYMPIGGIYQSQTGQEFVYRATPNTIKAKSFTLDRIQGKSLAWNQAVPLGGSYWTLASSTAASFSYNDGVITISSLQGAVAAKLARLNNFTPVIGHKYYLSVNIDATHLGSNYTASIALTKSTNANEVSADLDGGGKGRISQVGTTEEAVAFSCRLSNATPENEYAEFSNILLVDLTLLYGSEIDGMTDAQILAKYESEFPGYHSYESGKLISNDAESIETVGFNQWDEEWETGKQWNDYTGELGPAGASRIYNLHPIPVLPSTQYYGYIAGAGYIYPHFYDADMNYLGNPIEIRNGVFTTPANARYMNFHTYSYGTTYNHDICINLSDPAKNGTYEPYRKSVMQLGLDSFKVKSHNIWDEEWEVGDIAFLDGANYPTNAWIRSKRYIPCLPNTTYYIKCQNVETNIYFYDDAFNYLGQTTGGLNTQRQNNVFQTPNCSYIRFASKTTTSNNDICINLSSSFNGQYEPYGDITINGLKSAGSVYDEIVGNKYIKRINRVDLGSLNWSLPTTATYPYFQAPADGAPSSNTFGLIVPRYTDDQVIYDAGTYIDKCYGRNTGLIRIRDTAYATPAAFKAAMNGVYADYELATPIEYDLVEPLIYTMKAGTTEARISPNEDGLSAPFCCDMTYSASDNNDADNAQYAATAGRLLNTHTILGQQFNGTQNIGGAISDVSSIDGAIHFDLTNPNSPLVGISTTSPTVRLDVNGNVRGSQLISTATGTLASGTPPLTVASKTMVSNLNANYVGGKTLAEILASDITGNAATATKLQTGRNITISDGTHSGTSVSFDGSSAITLPLPTNLNVGTLDASGAITLSGAGSTNKRIYFSSNVYLELTSTGLHLNGAGLYSDSFITAYGTNESEALEALKAWVTENFEPKQS